MTETPHDGEPTPATPDAVTVETVPEKVWDPLQTSAPKIHRLAVAKRHGRDMAITLRPWSAKHRMAYEDIAPTLQAPVPGQVDEDGDEVWQVQMGSIKLLGASLTVIGSSGFPDVDGRPFLTGSREQRQADLGSIGDIALFEEILEAALEFEPLPGSTNDRKRMAEARGVKSDEDPSQTPPTQEQAAPATATPASPPE
jgi:hypothetical protein